MTVTFFGHRDATDGIKEPLKAVLTELILDGADNFLVGNNGAYDHIVRRTLKELKHTFGHIRYSVVLAYLPGKQDKLLSEDYSDTVFPEGLEKVPPRAAIPQRNMWMIERCDVAVVYANHFGNAQHFAEIAEKKGKRVIRLSK